MRLPSAQVLLEDFAERHHLRASELIYAEKVAIQATSLANILVKHGYSKLDDRGLADPAVGLLLNMLDRNLEHAEAAVVAFVSGCGSSAEVIARAALESSTNILYILNGNRAARLGAYFRYYLDEVDRHVEKWRAQLGDLTGPDYHLHNEAIDRRLAANDTMRAAVEALGISGAERWPTSIAQRFAAIDDGLGYRTFYARMSSEVHADAEATLHYLIARIQGNDELLEAMALETVWTTRLYIYLAAWFFLRASLAYALSYSLQGVDEPLLREVSAIERKLRDIGKRVGGM